MTTRWFVEVSPVDGSALGERYCVEALQWQQALQQARKLRGDRGSIARFAMELLEVGYRATDFTSRLRYTVSKAPKTSSLSSPPPSFRNAYGAHPPNNGSHAAPPAPATNGVTVPSPKAPPSETELEELSNPVLVALPPPLETNYEDALPTMPHASEVPPPVDAPSTEVRYETRPPEAPRSGPLRPSQIPLPRKSSRARAIQTSPAVPRPNRSHPPEAPVAASIHAGGSAAPNLEPPPDAPIAADAATAEEAVPTLPGLSLLSHRREEPTEAVPILYREFAFAFDAQLSPRELERYARAIWEQVKTTVAHRPPGKFVQVALFDHRFSDKPERAPAAVLAWKDWRGDPVIRIRKTKSEPTASVAPIPEAVTAPAVPVAPRPAPAITEAVPTELPQTDLVSDPTAWEVPAAPPVEIVQPRAESAPLTESAESAEVAIPLTSPAEVPLPLVETVAIPLMTPVPPAPEPEPFAVVPPTETPGIVVSGPIVETGDVRAAAVAPAPFSELVAPPAGSFPPPPAMTPLAPPIAPPLAPPIAPPVEVVAPEPPPAAVVEAPPVAPPPALAETPVPRAKQASAPSHRRTPAPRSSGNAVRRRGSSEDLISELFEEMHQLHFMPDIVSGADYVLSCVLFMLPCEGALVHVFDIDSRQFVVVRAAGPSFKEALLSRTPDTNPLFREALRQKNGSLSFPSTEGDERFVTERYQRLGVQPRSAMIGAAQHGGRYLGIIELLNPLGGEPYRESEVNALDYICEQFADFVASRPIVVDEDAVLPKA